jgi:hypothetical protein
MVTASTPHTHTTSKHKHEERGKPDKYMGAHYMSATPLHLRVHLLENFVHVGKKKVNLYLQKTSVSLLQKVDM